jgi:hypothetical protein
MKASAAACDGARMSSYVVRRVRMCARVAGTLVLVAAAMPSAASAVTVAEPGGPTNVREYRGTIVFGQFEPTSRRWYLTVRKAGARAAERLNVPSSPVPFNADIGTDSRGRPELIYERCTGATDGGLLVEPRPTSCDLFVYSLADATGERSVRNANDPNHNDVNPTLWNGRIAWTREYGSGKHADPVVYTKLLSAPRRQPSTRLPGVPQRRCGDVEKLCGPTTYRRVEALELSGDNLAVIVDYSCTGCSGVAQSELRLDQVTRGSSRRVALLIVGLAAQKLAGPSFFDGRLSWYKACGVAEPSCRTGVGPWRYRLATRRYERGRPGPIIVAGFADTGSRLYEVVQREHTSDFRIDELIPPSYSAAPAPLR